MGGSWTKMLMITMSLLLTLPEFSSVQSLSLINSKFKTSLNDLMNHKKVLSDLQLAGIKDFDPLSPEGSWFLFNQNDANQKKKNRSKKCKKCDSIPIPKEGPVGPQGSRGQVGPPGPSGGTLSLNEIEEYIKTYLRDLYLSNKTITDRALIDRGSIRNKAIIPVAFSAILPSSELVSPKKAVVIKGLTITFSLGQFKRGIAVTDGKFYVMKSGIYQINAIILYKLNKNNNKEEKLKEDLDKDISLFLCVDYCSKDRRLKWSTSVTPEQTAATLSGLVSLRRGQAIMILFSNPSSYQVEVTSESTFSASYIGS